ncbi:MAG: hypothetical protein RLY90_506, partial [Pseudomonadota bacterium]
RWRSKHLGYNFALTVAVAQLVESRIVIPVVVGSSPISHPKTSKGLQGFLANPFLFFRDLLILKFK